jgi:hypothetical protein
MPPLPWTGPLLLCSMHEEGFVCVTKMFTESEIVRIAMADKKMLRRFKDVHGPCGWDLLQSFSRLRSETQDARAAAVTARAAASTEARQRARHQEQVEVLQVQMFTRPTVQEHNRLKKALFDVAQYAAKSTQSAIARAGQKALATLPLNLPQTPTSCVVILKELSLGEVRLGPDGVSTTLSVSGHYLKLRSLVQLSVSDIIGTINAFGDGRKILQQDIHMENEIGGIFHIEGDELFHAEEDPEYEPDEIPEIVVVKGIVAPSRFTRCSDAPSRMLENSFDARETTTEHMIQQMIETERFETEKFGRFPFMDFDNMTPVDYIVHRGIHPGDDVEFEETEEDVVASEGFQGFSESAVNALLSAKRRRLN